MKELFVSTSAANYIKGDRVAYKFAEDEWYVGTVTKSGDKVSIHFDDDEKYTVAVSFKLKKVDHAKKKKTHLTDAEVRAIAIKNTKPAVPKPAPAPAPTLNRQQKLTKAAIKLLAYAHVFLNGEPAGKVSKAGSVKLGTRTVALTDVKEATSKINQYLMLQDMSSSELNTKLRNITKALGAGTVNDVLTLNRSLESMCQFLAGQ